MKLGRLFCFRIRKSILFVGLTHGGLESQGLDRSDVPTRNQLTHRLVAGTMLMRGVFPPASALRPDRVQRFPDVLGPDSCPGPGSILTDSVQLNRLAVLSRRHPANR